MDRRRAIATIVVRLGIGRASVESPEGMGLSVRTLGGLVALVARPRRFGRTDALVMTGGQRRIFASQLRGLGGLRRQ